MAAVVRNSLSRRLSLRKRGSTKESAGSSDINRSSVSSAEYSSEPLRQAFLDGPAVHKKAVVGIDFGTSNSGYAYAMTSDKKIRVVKTKEPTCVLMKKSNKKLIEFGLDARNFYRKAQAGQELLSKFSAQEQTRWEDDYVYIDQELKMRMYVDNHQQLSEKTDENEISYFEIVSAILGRIKDTALERIYKERSIILSPEDCLWVVTVPSIWRESDKQFMRRAAHSAELILEEFSGDLVIALESECAAIWAEVLFDKADDTQGLEAGDRVLCLDCGGGTVDISAIQLSKNPKRAHKHDTEISMSQLLPPTGLKIGAQNIDIRFRKFLKVFLGEENFNTCWTQPDSRMELQDGWERLKLSLKAENFSTKNRSRPLTLNLESTLMELNLRLPELVSKYNIYAKRKAAQRGGKARVIKLAYKKSLTRPATVLIIPPSLLHYCFDRTIHEIVRKTKQVFEEYLPDGVEHLVLYGGLGDCEYLQYSIRKEFEKQTRVHTPKNAGLAVMKGAVKYGMWPSIINSRRARMTVGIKITKPFIRGKHNKQPHLKHKEYDSERREYFIRDAFKTFVNRGQLVNVNEQIQHTFAPASKSKDTIKFDVYASSEKRVEYITEAGCMKLARIVVPIEKGSMRNITCALLFGYTEIRAKILDDEGNTIREIPLLYDKVGESAIISGEDETVEDKENNV